MSTNPRLKDQQHKAALAEAKIAAPRNEAPLQLVQLHLADPLRLWYGAALTPVVRRAELQELTPLPTRHRVPHEALTGAASANRVISTDVQTGKNIIAFVDPRVADYQELIKTFDPSVEVVVLDPAKDGVQQIADWLDGRSGIEAVHIISHGGPASIQLGSSELSASTIASYAPQLAAIGTALSADADILLYGCNVASGPEGRGFVEQSAALTQADIAASVDPTGSSSLGGDADLEVRVGDISTAAQIKQEDFRRERCSYGRIQ